VGSSKIQIARCLSPVGSLRTIHSTGPCATIPLIFFVKKGSLVKSFPRHEEGLRGDPLEPLPQISKDATMTQFARKTFKGSRRLHFSSKCAHSGFLGAQRNPPCCRKGHGDELLSAPKSQLAFHKAALLTIKPKNWLPAATALRRLPSKLTLPVTQALSGFSRVSHAHYAMKKNNMNHWCATKLSY
jgi:hypothetical protein